MKGNIEHAKNYLRGRRRSGGLSGSMITKSTCNQKQVSSSLIRGTCVVHLRLIELEIYELLTKDLRMTATLTTSTDGQDKSPLLILQVSSNESSASNASYGAINNRYDESPSSHNIIFINHDVVNHGHPYSDAIVDTIGREESYNNTTTNAGTKVTYWTLIRDNKNFRWYLLSYLVTHAGEWFSYVASISCIEQIQSTNNTITRTSISILVSLRLLPNALFTSIGGVLADSYDRKRIMFILDILGAFVALLFLLAYHMRSINALYLATALQMTVAAIYEPSRSAIVSMLVKDEESLKKAITISELAWSVMTSIGSSLGGLATAYLGISACFFIDSVSYFVSASFVWRIRGEFIATSAEKPDSCKNSKSGDKSFLSLTQFTTMAREGFEYVQSKPWGAFVLLKFCAALIYGASDVLNVSFSERGPNPMEGSSQRLGLLFAAVGIGCFIAPVIVDHFTQMTQVKSLERACMLSFGAMIIGCYGLSCVGDFLWVCIFTAVRAGGSSVLWIQSSLLIQKFSSGEMLGRVISVDSGLATLSEAFSAMCGGLLQDNVGLSAEQVSFFMSLVGLITLAIWILYFAVVRVD